MIYLVHRTNASPLLLEDGVEGRHEEKYLPVNAVLDASDRIPGWAWVMIGGAAGSLTASMAHIFL